ncbi:MAG: hypothetical protein LRY57_04320 [Alphaproteobacteria bacterium]|nr:hypothetical protein [Alphaproteobacteria bacterium]
MIKKTGPLAAAALASIMGSQALAAESPAAPPAQNTKFTTVTGSFCPQGTPRETAYINISFNAHKDGMTDAEAQSTYRSDIVSLTRKTWKKPCKDTHWIKSSTAPVSINLNRTAIKLIAKKKREPSGTRFRQT